jgi:hypothetical protein
MKVFNVFWVPGKIPSLNELIYSKSSTSRKPQGIITIGKKKNTFVFNKYNQMKQEWTLKISTVVNRSKFNIVSSCYFSYLIIEKTKKRDPSNLGAAAIKFFEDSLVYCGVIENDGWKCVLGINYYWEHLKLMDPGVLLCMSDSELTKLQMMDLYKNV